MGIHIMPPLYKMVIVPPAPPPTTAYFYPDAHPESTSVDGYAQRTDPNANETWAQIHDGAGTLSGDATAQNYIGIKTFNNPQRWQEIQRIITLFDTSSIDPGKTILAAELRVKCYSKSVPQVWPAFSAIVVPSLPADNWRVVMADYQALGTTPLSNVINHTGFTPGAHTTFTFNSAGLAAIAKGGITKLGIREDHYDRADSPPPWVEYGWDRILLWSADQADIEATPRLKVVYQ